MAAIAKYTLYVRIKFDIRYLDRMIQEILGV